MDPWQAGPPSRELGVTLFTIGTGGPDFSLTNVREWIRWRDQQNGR